MVMLQRRKGDVKGMQERQMVASVALRANPAEIRDMKNIHRI